MTASPKSKKCKQCEVTKPLSEFYKRKDRPDGIGYHCKECADARTRRNGKLRREDPEKSRRERIARRSKGYNISLEESERLENIERCQICKRTAEEVAHAGPSGKSLHTDHDHYFGLVRGMLCKSCNTALGLAGDSSRRLRALADYLDQSWEDHMQYPLTTLEGAMGQFAFHPATKETAPKHAAVRDLFARTLELLWPELPDGPEKTLVIRKLQEAQMYANLAIALTAPADTGPTRGVARELPNADGK